MVRVSLLGIVAVTLVCGSVVIVRAADAPENPLAVAKPDSHWKYPGESPRTVLRRNLPKVILTMMLGGIGAVAMSRRVSNAWYADDKTQNRNMSLVTTLSAALAIGLGMYVGSEVKRAHSNKTAWDKAMADKSKKRIARNDEVVFADQE